VDHPQFDFFIIIDFEATCQESNTHFVQEIIEFPAVLVDAEQRQIVS
jgi:ERI1 exoribonuclease 2